MKSDVLAWLQGWYNEQWHEEWDHEYGIRIETLDNPGWSVRISLEGTVYADRLQVAGEKNAGEYDWLAYKVKDRQFHGACGPENLTELLESFRTAVLANVPSTGQ